MLKFLGKIVELLFSIICTSRSNENADYDTVGIFMNFNERKKKFRFEVMITGYAVG